VVIETHILFIGLVTFFLAGLTQGLTGFGFGLVAVPLLSFFISPRVVAPMIVLYTSVTNLMVVSNSWRYLNISRIYILTLAALLGIPFGTWIINSMEPDLLRLFIGIVVSLSAILMAVGIKFKINREKIASIFVGFVSGILSGSIAVGGPPVILFFTNQEVPREEFRANIAAYFAPISWAANLSFYVGGLLTMQTILYSLWFVPALIAGVFIGNRFNELISEIIYRRAALIIVFSAGMLSIMNGLGIL
jgi:uncharacterized membrane protein YfcA